MDDSSGLSSLWLNYGSQLMGASMDAAMQYSSQKWNEKEAKKVRDWNVEMYERQLADNRENWRMMNEFNLPSAQLARLRDSGLNPLLMYSNGAQGLTVSNAADGAHPASSPAASGFMRTNFGQALANVALTKAQVKNIEADTQVKQNEAKNLSNIDEFYQLTKDLDIAKKTGDLKYLDESIHNLATQSDSLQKMTDSQLKTLQQARDFQIKYYNLDEKRIENQIWYNIEQIALGNAQVNAQLQQISVNLYEAKTHRYQAQTDRYRAETERQSVENQNRVFVAEIAKIQADQKLTEQEKLNKMVEFLKTHEQYQMLLNAGTEDYGGIVGAMLMLSGNVTGRIGGNRFYNPPPYTPGQGQDYHNYYNSGD